MSKSIRAKFTVQSVTNFENGSSISLKPVTNDSEENKAFFKWTPSGEINISLLNKETANEFSPGDEFYVDFTKAE